MITIALAKGRLADSTADILERCGVDCSILREKSRKLVFQTAQGYRFILVKPSDVPSYVFHGVADMGVAGKDTIMETAFPLFEMLDLEFGKCKMCVCGLPKGFERSMTVSNMRVATKYPHIAENYYAAKGEAIEIIKLNGSVEIAPILGLSDVIMDIVESGQTLRENGLTVLEEVCSISARVIVNRVSLKTRGTEIKQLINKMKGAVEK